MAWSSLEIVGFVFGLICAATICFATEEPFFCVSLSILSGCIIMAMFGLSPLNQKQITKTYQLKEIEKSVYYQSPTSDKFVVNIETSSGVKSKSFDINIVSFKTTTDSPKIKITTLTYKYVPRNKSINKKVIIYLPKENTVNQEKQVDDSISCKKCNYKNSSDANFCSNCGSKLNKKRFCPNCEEEIINQNHYPNCEQKIKNLLFFKNQ